MCKCFNVSYSLLPFESYYQILNHHTSNPYYAAIAKSPAMKEQ